MADQRLAADQRHLNRIMFFDQAENPVDQLIAAKIGNIAQRALAAQVRFAVGIASRTT